MDIKQVLRQVELFEGLSEAELIQVAAICTLKELHTGDTLIHQGEQGDQLYIITEGFVEVVLSDAQQQEKRVVVNLGPGQIIGEIALLDQGPRSASVRATAEPTIVQSIHHNDFNNLCAQNNHIGYLVMRNMAADLSFKLRHRNLADLAGG
jgi:CRP/FNR family transcriptional regulator, cyclic AMP receptor protein